MKKLKIGFTLMALALFVSCSSQELAEDTQPIPNTIEQKRGSQSNGNGGGVQSYPCYNNSSATNGGSTAYCTPSGSGSGSGN